MGNSDKNGETANCSKPVLVAVFLSTKDKQEKFYEELKIR